MSIIQSVGALIRKLGAFLRIKPGTLRASPEPEWKTIDDLLKIIRDDKLDQVADYLKRGGDPNFAMHLNGRPLFLARSAEMVDLLIGAGAEVDPVNELGLTAAHLMAEEDKRLPALQHLVKAGANPNPIDHHFETPLDSAHRKNATANAAWLESIGAETGPLATYRRLHPLLRNDSATRPAGPLPSLAQPIQDRSALWQHLRDLIRFWDPTVDWQLIKRAASATALNSLAGIELPPACLEFHQSGIFDWLLWKGGNKEHAFMRCSWATADAIGRRADDEIIPVMQDSNMGLCWIERDELGNADPAVRYSARQKIPNDNRNPPYSRHTGCRFSEFVANLVYSELVEVTPARRYVDLETSRDRQAVRLRERLTRVALPRLRSGATNVTFVAIYEGPNTLYVEIEAPSQSRGYYGILGGDSKDALGQLVEEEETDDFEEDDFEGEE